MRYILAGLFLLLCGPASADITAVKVQVLTRSTVNVNGMAIEYSDAQYLPADAVKADGSLTKEASDKVVAEETARVERWKDAIEHPAPIKEPTKEELQAQLTALEEQKTQIENQKVEVQAKLTAISVSEEPIEEPKEEPIEEVK